MAKKKRTKLADRVLPNYTRGEEIFNMVSHIVGGGFAIIYMILCIIIAAVYGDVWGVVSSCVYGITMVVLYCMSSWTSKRNSKEGYADSRSLHNLLYDSRNLYTSHSCFNKKTLSCNCLDHVWNYMGTCSNRHSIYCNRLKEI